jgi:predicted lipoprotein with Yx(FWY)xxD motif
MTGKPIRTIEEAAAEVAANWPPLTADQRDKLSRIFAPVVRAEAPGSLSRARRG